jgi:2-polyprenyl-6-methoxyphenol hydroxylase-like FAD-dependent oxidoreductase
MTKVAIIGAGIGGLTAALALHSREIDVSIYERSRQMEASGAGIQLSCNPNHVLTDLSVLDAALGVAFEPEALNVVDGHTGSILLSVRLGGWARQRYGAPYLNIHRGDLQQVLLDAVQQRIPGALELGKRVIGVSQAVSVMFAEGQEIDADIVVGADGVHSVLRETVTSVEPARFTGHVAYRMLIPRSEMPTRSIPPPVVTMRLGRHGHVVGYWVTGGDVYNVVAVAEDDRWHEENWRTPAELDEVRSAFRAWDSQLRTLIDNARDVYKLGAARSLGARAMDARPRRSARRLLSCHAALPRPGRADGHRRRLGACSQPGCISRTHQGAAAVLPTALRTRSHGSDAKCPSISLIWSAATGSQRQFVAAGQAAAGFHLEDGLALRPQRDRRASCLVRLR